MEIFGFLKNFLPDLKVVFQHVLTTKGFLGEGLSLGQKLVLP